MKKISFALSLFAVALMSVVTQAASFSIVGAGNLPAGTTSGTLDIVYNPAADGASFADGGVALKITSGTPGVIKFTTATILNGPPTRWSDVVVSGISDNSVGVLNGFSVGSPGLSTTASSVYAQIGYQVVGTGTTQLSLATQGEDPLYDGVRGDVSGITALLGAALTAPGNVIPEPATLAMAGMSLVGLVLRRRNG